VLVDLVAHRFRVLGHPVRLRLIDLIDRRGEANVQALADHVSTTQQNASRHLAVLTDAGLLDRRQEGRVVWYRLAHPNTFAVVERTAAAVIAELRAPDRMQ